MIGEALRHAASRGNGKDIYVAVVLASEGNSRSVRREDSSSFHTRAGRKTPGFAAFAWDAPQITGVGEDNLSVTQGRITKEQVTALGRRKGRRNQKEGKE